MEHSEGKRRALLAPAKVQAIEHKDIESSIDSLRAMAWAYAASHYQRATPSQLSELVSRHSTGEGAANSKVMYQYLKGLRLPIPGKRGKNHFDLIDFIEREAGPVGARITDWLTHPLWQIFSPRVKLNEMQTLPEVRPEGLKIALSYYAPNQEQLDSLLAGKDRPRAENFEDYVYVCRLFVSLYRPGVWSPYRWLVLHLIDEAAEVEPVFRYIKEPFRRMIEDLYPEQGWNTEALAKNPELLKLLVALPIEEPYAPPQGYFDGLDPR